MSKKDKVTVKKESVYEIHHTDRTAVFEQDILKENKPKFSYLVKMFRYITSSAKLMCGIFLSLAIIVSILQPILAFIWGKFIDRAGNYSVEKDFASLIVLALCYWLLSFINDILNQYLYGGESIQKLDLVQSNRLQEKFHSKLYQKISKLYPEYMEVPKINDIIKRSFDSMGNEWSGIQRGVLIEGYIIIAKLVSVVMIAASLYIFHPLLCIIVLIAPIPTLYTTYVGNRLQFKFSRDNGKILREAGYYQGILLGSSLKEVKALNLFDFFFGNWKTLADEYVVKEKANQMHVFILNIISSLISNFASAAANIIAIILLTRGELSLGALGAVMVLINTLMDSTSRLFGSVASFVSKKNESAQFFEFIDLSEQKFEGTDIGKIESVELKDVSYRYPLTDNYRIDGVSLKLKQGEKVAFVGENGAGKTTFIKLLTGMLKPSGGEIIISGIPMDNINDKSRYYALSSVFQEPSRFHTFTVGDNVFLGDTLKERNEKEIDEALAFSGFDAADKDALLGKDIGGTDLSGGQWQKIAIARAYYRGRDFIVLDEPTSNLDPLAETEVFQKYIDMSKDKTVVMVTHRISVASLADRVVVFKEGKIVEDGTHQELILKNGEYARLYSTQAQWYDR